MKVKYAYLALSLLLAGQANIVKADSDRLSQMISPAFSPVTFEDPRALSEARLLFVNHSIDDNFVTNGGDVQVYALQLRYALTDKLSIIATKDGYVDFNPKANVPKDSGFADIEAGLKYTVLEDKEKGYIASAQLRYLIPTGEKEVFQGQGDGVVHPSFSGAIALCDNTTLTAGSGLRIPVNGNDSSFWDVDAQLDYRIPVSGDISIYPLVGASLVKVIDSGKRLGIADEGQDFFNFGATESAGENIVTGVGGLRARLASNFDIGGSFQFPFDRSSGSRIINNRWTFDAILRF